MSDKKDRGYDPCLLRAVGNIMAGCTDKWMNQPSAWRNIILDQAIEASAEARVRLRNLQHEEESY